MDDQQVLGQINALVEEEDRLRLQHDDEPLGDDERRRVDQIEVELDRCWDLLRQRRARKEFDRNPDTADVRSADTVEHYQQ